LPIYSPCASAGKMPSQAVVWNWATQLMRSQMAFTTSTSKPTIWPLASTVSNGGYVVSEPTTSVRPPRSWADAKAARASAANRMTALLMCPSRGSAGGGLAPWRYAPGPTVVGVEHSQARTGQATEAALVDSSREERPRQREASPSRRRGADRGPPRRAPRRPPRRPGRTRAQEARRHGHQDLPRPPHLPAQTLRGPPGAAQPELARGRSERHGHGPRPEPQRHQEPPRAARAARLRAERHGAALHRRLVQPALAGEAALPGARPRPQRPRAAAGRARGAERERLRGRRRRGLAVVRAHRGR